MLINTLKIFVILLILVPISVHAELSAHDKAAIQAYFLKHPELTAQERVDYFKTYEKVKERQQYEETETVDQTIERLERQLSIQKQLEAMDNKPLWQKILETFVFLAFYGSIIYGLVKLYKWDKTRSAKKNK
jgi:hypothetical protein